MDYQTLSLLYRSGIKSSHQKIRLHDLSETELLICSYLDSHDRCSQDEVSSAVKIDKTTVGKALAALERKNVVIRAKDDADKRIKRLTLTEDGRNKVSELADLHNRWLTEILSCLSPEEQQSFETICLRLISAAEAITQKNGESQ